MRREEAAKLAPGTWCRCAYSVGHILRVEAVEDGGRSIRMLAEWGADRLAEPRHIYEVLPSDPKRDYAAEQKRDVLRARRAAEEEARLAWARADERARAMSSHLCRGDRPSATVWARTPAEANAILDVIERLRAGGEP